MDFTPELSALQGVIISADNVHPFSKITARGGNEEKIIDIVQSIFCFLQDKQYVNEEGTSEKAKSVLRKYCFYLILNSDFSVLEELVEMPGIDTVIWTVPTITQCLICDIIWSLDMENYLYEILSFCNPLLSLQVLVPFVDSIKYSDPIKCLKKIEILCTATYRLICRLHFFQYENNSLSKLLSDIYDNFLRCLKYFESPPKFEQLDRLAVDDLYKYKGNGIHVLLTVTIQCLTHFMSTQKFEPEGFEDMYLLTIKPECIRTRTLAFVISESDDSSVLAYIQKCNTNLLDICMSLLMDVSVDIFCAWSEFEYDGKNMQKCIGELCYSLLSKIGLIDTLAEHPIVKILPQLSSKPVDIHDLITSADCNVIIENVNKDTEHKIFWLQAILEKRDLYQNFEYQECLVKNLEYLKQEDHKKLADGILTFVKNNEPSETLKKIFVTIINQCNAEEAEIMLSVHFPNKYFNNVLELNTFDIYVTEIFNKFISTADINLSELYSCFIQNPYKIYTQIVHTAIANLKQSEMMVNLITLLRKYCDYYYESDTEPCIVKVVEDAFSDQILTEPAQASFISFMAGIKKNNILPGAKLLLLIIMPKLYKALVEKETTLVNIQLKLLGRCFSTEELLEYRAPLLAMLGQTLDVLRWNILTFDWAAPSALREAVELQNSIFNTYQGHIPDKDANWLKQKLNNLQPMNMYYYKEIWKPPGDNFIEIISGEKELEKKNLILLLSKVLCTSIPTEWQLVWNSLKNNSDTQAVDIIFESINMIAIAESRNRTDHSWQCIQNVYRNFILLMKNEYLKPPLSDSHVENALDKVIDIANLHSAEEMEAIEPILLSLFSYIAERKQDYRVDVSYFSYRLQHSKFAVMINQIFSNGNA